MPQDRPAGNQDPPRDNQQIQDDNQTSGESVTAGQTSGDNRQPTAIGNRDTGTTKTTEKSGENKKGGNR